MAHLPTGEQALLDVFLSERFNVKQHTKGYISFDDEELLHLFTSLEWDEGERCYAIKYIVNWLHRHEIGKELYLDFLTAFLNNLYIGYQTEVFEKKTRDLFSSLHELTLANWIDGILAVGRIPKDLQFLLDTIYELFQQVNPSTSAMSQVVYYLKNDPYLSSEQKENWGHLLEYLMSINE